MLVTFLSVLAKMSSVLAIFSSVLVENYVYCKSPTHILKKNNPIDGANTLS